MIISKFSDCRCSSHISYAALMCELFVSTVLTIVLENVLCIYATLVGCFLYFALPGYVRDYVSYADNQLPN